MSAAREVGVQSWCFRHFKDNAEVAAKIRELGLSRIEVCGVHADFNDPTCWAAAFAPFAAAGIEVMSLGVQTFTGDVATERNWFACAKQAGAKYISAHFKVDTFHKAVPAAIALCDEFGIKLALHCHGGYQFGGSRDVISHLLALGQGRIGLCLDTGWCLQSGNANPVEWAKQYGELLFGIHYKDFRFKSTGGWEDMVPGTASLDLPAFVAAVEAVGFKGYAVFEYEGSPENPMPKLHECVAALAAVP
jgi:sugar phosphate isomerase/epimerase